MTTKILGAQQRFCTLPHGTLTWSGALNKHISSICGEQSPGNGGAPKK